MAAAFLGLLCVTNAGFPQADFWQETTPPSSYNVLSLAVNSSGEVFAGTDSAVFHSVDRGQTWIVRLAHTYPLYFGSIAIDSRGYIYVGIEAGSLMGSTDNGLTWNQLLAFTSGEVYATSVNGADHIFVCGCNHSQCASYRSTSSGQSWTASSFYPWGTVDIRSYAFETGGICFAGGRHFGIIRSSDNGDTWVMPDTTLIGTHVYSLAVQPGGYLFAGTSTGIILRSTNQGDSWETVRAGPGPLVSSLVINIEGEIFAATLGEGVLRSMDNGDSWEPLNAGLANLTVHTLAIDFQGFIYAGTSGGRVFRSVGSTLGLRGQVGGVASVLSLSQNYPNPFNPTTIITFTLPYGRSGNFSGRGGQFAGSGSTVVLKVFDLLGRVVTTLVEGVMRPGEHQVIFNGKSLPGGVYFYRLETEFAVKTKRMLLIR